MLKIYALLLYAAFSLLFISCSSEQKEKKEAETNEQFSFKNETNKQGLNLILKPQNTEEYPLNIQIKRDDKSANKQLILLSFLPDECSFCKPTITHINNLLSRFKNVDSIIISMNDISAKSYKELLIDEPRFSIFIASESELFSILDSIKRQLNIEISDNQSPFVLLVDNSGNVLSSYEGPILEEVFDIDISTYLSRLNK